MYIAPDDTIFNTPLRDSLLCSLMSIFLSMVPDCIAYIFFFRLSHSLLSNSLLTPLLVLNAVKLPKLLQRTDSLRWKAADCWHKNNPFCCFDRDSSAAQGIFFDTSNMEASSRRISAVRGRWTRVLSMAEGWYEKREGRWRKPVQLAAVVSIGTANQGVQALAVSPSMVTVLI